MAIIDPDGLFNGERLARCSDTAKLYWPYLFVASNSLARIELNYRRILSRVFPSFHTPPTENQFFEIIREYQSNFLIFVYEFEGQTWGQWDTDDQYLPRYQSVKDKRSPAPDKKEFVEFRRNYRISKKCEKFPKISLGVGVGVGVGIGVGDGIDFENLSKEDEFVNIKTEIEKHCRQILKLDAAANQFTWAKIKELVGDHGGFAVDRAFRTWAEANKMGSFYKPVDAFLNEADDLLGDPNYTPVGSTTAVGSEAELNDLCSRLFGVGKQLFADKLKLAIKDLMITYPADEIFNAWNYYAGPMDENEVKFAPKKFCTGGAIAIILSRRADAAKIAANERMMAAVIEREQAKAAAEDTKPVEEIEETLSAE